MKVSDYIAQYLSKYVDHVFCGNGGVVVHLLDSFSKFVKLVPCEHEQAAAIAAEAYSRVTGKIGIAVATSGPGFINLLQGIACAYYDSVPVLFIVGAPPTSHLRTNNVRQRGFQEMNVMNIVKPFVKYAARMNSVQVLDLQLKTLLKVAINDRPGPVLLEIPDDIQRMNTLLYHEPDDFISLCDFQNVDYISRSILYEIRHYIFEAKQPLVIIGAGAKHCDESVFYFLRETNIPFVTTWATVDMFTTEWKNWIGTFGITGSKYGNLAVQNCDLLLVLGSRLDTHQTGSRFDQFAPNAKVIVVDIDENELDKFENDYIKINYDVGRFLYDLGELEVSDLLTWYKQLQLWKTQYPICRSEYKEKLEYVDPYVFMDELSKVTKKGDIIITDAGATLTWTMQGYIPKVKQTLFSAFNHSPMGYALPAAIGAQYALPDKNVICITGDGGMQMNIQELETIIYNSLPIKIFVFDNQGYGIIRQTQDAWLNGRHIAAGPESGLGMPDMRQIAAAYKIPWIVIERHGQLSLIKELERDSPMICIVKIDPEQQIIPKLLSGQSLEEI